MSDALSLKEIQECELEILKRIVSVLKENNIHYFLAYGTMLGAVRHDGFIPWDDDIDIFVPRDDYEKLKLILRNKGLTEKYLSYGIPGDKGYPYPFIKITDLRYRVQDQNIKDKFQLNLWIDVFPLDHLPDDDVRDKTITIKTSKIMSILSLEITKMQNANNARIAVKRVIGKLLGGYSGINKYIDRRARRINSSNMNSNVLGNIVWPQYGRDFFSKRMTFPVVSHQFCDESFMIPEDYENHLSYLYGDFMQLPPEEKRQRHYITVYREK